MAIPSSIIVFSAIDTWQVAIFPSQLHILLYFIIKPCLEVVGLLSPPPYTHKKYIPRKDEKQESYWLRKELTI